MTNLIQEAKKLQDFLFFNNWRFCFIGGIAVQQWGEPRLTRDVDVTLWTSFSGEENFIQPLLNAYQGRVADPKTFALENRVLLLQSSEGIGIDISFAGLPFEEELIRRASDIQMLPGIALRLCTAEDLIVLKAFASRPHDWQDVSGVIVRQGEAKLDWNYILKNLKILAELKEEPQILTELTSIRQKISKPLPS